MRDRPNRAGPVANSPPHTQTSAPHQAQTPAQLGVARLQALASGSSPGVHDGGAVGLHGSLPKLRLRRCGGRATTRAVVGRCSHKRQRLQRRSGSANPDARRITTGTRLDAAMTDSRGGQPMAKSSAQPAAGTQHGARIGRENFRVIVRHRPPGSGRAACRAFRDREGSVSF